MNSWKVILATLVIFGAGVVTGGLLVSHVDAVRPAGLAPRSSQTPPAPPAVTPWQARMRDLMRRMDNTLDLQPEQRAHIEKIMDDSQERTMGLWRPIVPQMNREMQNVRDQIRRELNPKQLRKFDSTLRPPRPPRRPEDPANPVGRNRPANGERPLTQPDPATNPVTNALAP